MAYALLYATVEGCALVNAWPTFAPLTTSPPLREQCRRDGREGLACYYRPLSTCAHPPPGAPSPRSLDPHKIIDGAIGPLLDATSAATGLSSELLVRGQAHTHRALPTPCTFPRRTADPAVHRVWRR